MKCKDQSCDADVPEDRPDSAEAMYVANLLNKKNKN